MSAGRLRRSMAAAHTWSGLLLGWLLYAMFCCGTIAFFREEVTRWMQPELVPARGQAAAVADAQAWLARHAESSTAWYITPPSGRAAPTQLYWNPLPGGAADAPTSARLDGSGEETKARDTGGGFFLYRLHFDLHYMPVLWARYLVGVAAMFMLVAILSGIITHKKIFADFFLLRFRKGQRSWLDAHNVTAVLALPFHLMITYTGLVTLASLYAPAPIHAAFASEDSHRAAAFPGIGSTEASGARAPLAPLAGVARDAARRLGATEIGYLTVYNPGDRAGTVAVTSSPAAGFDARGTTLAYDAATGRLRQAPAKPGGARLTESVMIGLHAGRYAGLPLRWLYFAAGLFGTAMVATGLVLWTAKRRARLAQPHFGFALVERLNIGVVAGFPLALASYFLANRLIPAALPGRAEWEVTALFATLAAALAWAALRSPARGWREIAGAGCAAFLAVVASDVALVGNPLAAWWRSGSPLFAAVDATMLAAALACATVARRSGRKQARGRAA